MLKRISAKYLRTGMFLHELCGSWMDHPFWRTSFMLDSQKDIDRIIDSGIREVWIDTAKGLDVDDGPGKQEVQAQIDSGQTNAAGDPDRIQQAVQLHAELQHARRIIANSKEVVLSMFQEARMGAAIKAEQASNLVDEIGASVIRNSQAIISIARLKKADEYTYMHSVSVCALMMSLARELGLDAKETHDSGIAGLFHDIGKTVIPAEILNKPGKLTNDEFALIKTHPEKGRDILLGAQGITEVALEVCLHHHEKSEGSGYPHRLTAEGITLFSKMGAVCDVYDAITSDRPYKRGWDPGEAVRKMAEWRSDHFDERIFQAFVKCVGIYPVGTVVRLQSGRIGMIVEQSNISLLTPKVNVFFSTKANAYVRPEVIDLARLSNKDEIVANENPAKWNLRGLGLDAV